MQTNTIVDVKNISLSFREKQKTVNLFSEFSLSLEKNSLYTLLGPTGCGKTTLLNIIAGIITPDSGTVEVQPHSVREKTRCVFQHYTLFPWLTVLDNTAFGLKMRKVPKKDRREQAAQALKMVALEGSEHLYPHQLSGGMRQRAAIAQALATKPELLLMDEPFGALDDYTRTDLQEMLLKLHESSSLTTLFVTHSIEEAVRLGNRIILMAGAPAEIVEDLDTAAFRDQIENNSDALFLRLRNALRSRIITDRNTVPV